jgi:protein-L-isoaspartate(D-aspartate) O-methyltransferase
MNMTVLSVEEYMKAREKMVRTQLVATGVRKQSLIERFGKIEREKYTPKEFKLIAYSAKEIPLAHKRFLLNPMYLGLILDCIDYDSIKNALIIADSTGYVATLLSSLINKITVIDSVLDFKKNLTPILEYHNINNIKIIEGDILKGYPQNGPYDLIFINGAVQQIPNIFFEQLSKNGKILTPLKKPFISQATFQYKINNTVQIERLLECSVSLIPEFSQSSKFVF